MALAPSGAGAIDATKRAALAAGAQLGVAGAKGYQQAHAQLAQQRTAELATLGGVGAHAGFTTADPAYSAGINQAIASRQAALANSQAAFTGANAIGNQGISDYLDATKASLGAAVAWAKATGRGGGGGGSKAKGPSNADITAALLTQGAAARDKAVSQLLSGAKTAGTQASSHAQQTFANVPGVTGDPQVITNAAEFNYMRRRADIGRDLASNTTPTGFQTIPYGGPPPPPGAAERQRQGERLGLIPPLTPQPRTLQAPVGGMVAPGTADRAKALLDLLNQSFANTGKAANLEVAQRDINLARAPGAASRSSADYARLLVAANPQLSALLPPSKLDALLTPSKSNAFESALLKERNISNKPNRPDALATALSQSGIDPSFAYHAQIPGYKIPKGTKLAGGGVFGGTTPQTQYASSDAELASALGFVDKQGNPDTSKITAAIRKQYTPGGRGQRIQDYIEKGLSAAAGNVSDVFGFGGAPSEPSSLLAEITDKPELAAAIQGYIANPRTAAQGKLLNPYIEALVRAALANRAAYGQTLTPAQALYQNYYDQYYRQ